MDATLVFLCLICDRICKLLCYTFS